MNLQLFAMNTNLGLGENIAASLGMALSPHEERDFEDGEHKTRPLVSVRGQDVFVVQSLFSEPEQSVNDKFCRLLFFIGALKDASAQSVTAVIPYFGYARKDRKTKDRDPVTTKYMAQLFEAVGTDRVITMDVHNLAAYQNSFRISAEHLEARVLFAPQLAALISDDDVVVVSPDAGGMKRAEQMRENLAACLKREVGLAFLEKKRSEGQVTGDRLVGDVKGRIAILVDDIISSGATMGRAVQSLHKHGAKKSWIVATHGIFVGVANEVLADSRVERVFITDTIPPFRLKESLLSEKVTVLETGPLWAAVIRNVHEGRSLIEIMAKFK